MGNGGVMNGRDDGRRTLTSTIATSLFTICFHQSLQRWHAASPLSLPLLAVLPVSVFAIGGRGCWAWSSRGRDCGPGAGGCCGDRLNHVTKHLPLPKVANE